MLTTTMNKTAVVIEAADLARVLSLYEAGQYVQAHALASSIGPLEAWTGTAARIVAGRLAMNLGAHRLAVALHLRAWRADPTDPEATYYHARSIFGRQGPLRAWAYYRKVGELPEAADEIRADWYANRAVVLGHLRDFDAADAWMARAEAARPEWPWVQIERAHLLEVEDRYEDSLAASRFALELQPWYRPGVQAVARTLQLLRRDREAVDLLVEAGTRIESGAIAAQLAGIQEEMGHYEDSRRNFERFAELSPMMDKETRKWLAARRSDLAYHCGDHVKAAEFARESLDPFFLKLADRLEAPGEDTRRVTLGVPFVRQHHMTCAPATLAAISRFWSMPADHLEVADAICYDGTPDHRERSWAETNGWVTREFTVTREAAVALIDRGIPFTLTTIETMSGHLQAVTGYDARRGTILFRDPTLPTSGEAFADGLLERYRSTGPRGMALVPKAREDLFAGLELPDAPFYDDLYQMQISLREHDRTRAVEIFETLKTKDPAHRLTLNGRRLLAIYDADPAEILATVERLLELFPDDANLLLGKLACLRDFAQRDDRLALLKGICENPKSDPIFQRQYAQELMADAREHATAERLFRRVLRLRPLDDLAVYAMANIAWDRGDHDESFDLYRVAACLDDKDEGLARAYFIAARHLRRTEETLRFLEARARRFARQSSRPARTLYWALSLFERMPEAFEVLDQAIKVRPDDGDLHLFTAEAHIQHGEFDRASDRLKAAQGHSRREAWLRTSAQLATAEGRNLEALTLWQDVLKVEPASIDAQAAVARLLAELEGRAAALDHLRKVSERFPHNFALHQLWSSWAREEGPATAEPIIRMILAIHPADAWARRELALVLSEQGKHDEAQAEVEQARQLDPRNTVTFSVMAQVLMQAGKRSDAKVAYREAIQRSVDNDYAIARLIDDCESRAERLEVLAFVEGELVRQVTLGDGLFAFSRRAKGVLEPLELLQTLRNAWESRPELWQSWSALIGQLIEAKELDEALVLALQSIERFPLMPRLRYDLATVAQAREDSEGEIEALREALRISPGWSAAARQLSEAVERRGYLVEARRVMEEATARDPLDGLNQGWLADAHWKLDEKDQAIERIIQAVRLDPGYEWAWESLRRWSIEQGQPDLAIELARELTTNRPGEARSWFRLARSLNGPEAFDERIAALDRTIEINPRLAEAIDLRAELLAGVGRFDEAEIGCEADVWDGPPPLSLRGRSAWLKAQQGHFDRAIEQMRVLVADDPDYYWGWKNLAEWLCDHSTPEDYLEAAGEMVRLGPNDPVALAYRGEAQLKLGRRDEAKADYRQAITLAPDYPFAALALFDLVHEDKDEAETDALLAHLKEHVGGDFVTSREVQLAVDRGDPTVASIGLRALCVSTEAAPWPISAADQAFQGAGWSRMAESIYVEVLDRGDPLDVQVGKLWIQSRITRGEYTRDRRLDRLFEAGSEAGIEAMLAYVSGLGKAGQGRAVSACIRRHRVALRSNVKCWGAVGFALSSVCQWPAAVAWLADWRDREGLVPWMLSNLVIALQSVGNDAEARVVGLHALEMAPDYTVGHHRVWVALDDATAGRTEVAEQRLAEVDTLSIDRLCTSLHALAQALIDLQKTEPAARPAAFVEIRRRLVSTLAVVTIPPDDFAAARHAYRRAIRRMAQDAGGPLASLWRIGRWLVPLIRKGER